MLHAIHFSVFGVDLRAFASEQYLVGPDRTIARCEHTQHISQHLQQHDKAYSSENNFSKHAYRGILFLRKQLWQDGDRRNQKSRFDTRHVREGFAFETKALKKKDSVTSLASFNRYMKYAVRVAQSTATCIALASSLESNRSLLPALLEEAARAKVLVSHCSTKKQEKHDKSSLIYRDSNTTFL